MRARHTPPVNTQRSIWLMVFGLPFLLVGIGFLLWSIVPTLYDAWRMQDWRTTQGTLSHARLTTSRSSDSTTYGVEARYRYSVGGYDFTGSRVAINSGNDNVGRFQQDLGHLLEHRLRNHQPVDVYYDPSRPADSVLNRDLRWGLLGLKSMFVVLFGGIGAGMVYWGFRGKKAISVANPQATPWLSRPEWQGGVIRSQARGGMIALWVIALIWNLLSTPAAMQFMAVWSKEGAVALLILLFPLVGLVLLGYAIKLTREWKRFGVTPLAMDPFPGAIGGDVGGEIKVNIAYRSDMLCKVTLSCIHSYMSGSGKNRSRKEQVKWQDDGYARVHSRGAAGITLQFRFHTPTGLPESEESSSNYHLWRLHVELDTDGADLDRSFEIPVYATGESSRRINVDSSSERPANAPRISVETLLPISAQGNARIIDYPMLRKPGSSLAGLLAGSVFAGAGLFMWNEAAREGFSLYLMASVFSLVGWGIVLAVIYSSLSALTIRFDGHSLSFTRRLLGQVIQQRSVPYADIADVRIDKGQTSQTGNRHRIEYRIHAQTSQGKILIAEALPSASAARLVEHYFREEFSLNDELRLELD